MECKFKDENLEIDFSIPNLVELAAVVFWIDEVAGQKLCVQSHNNPYADYSTYEEAREMFMRIVNEAIKEPTSPWYNFKHVGDCTNMACTCETCLVLEYLERATRKWGPIYQKASIGEKFDPRAEGVIRKPDLKYL